ncbi:hypothetical protein Harman_41790 [Haloarcula mannanilytica]|uniref:Uncharacterized protein n=1 Tax=Haloarcula mannanilytica TaxID=2509225 RepID=A0A4C2ENQ6_9EURY|nr:hypothetical protein Harman_41790 [Haloarcula mannanilytica]
MSSAQPAFGGMFRQLIKLDVVNVNTEPLDAGLEQTANTFGIVRSLTLAGESTESIVDCLVIGAFRSST